MPCGYLITSRYSGVVPVVGYAWLELLPVTVALVMLVGSEGLLYPVMQLPFIGLYEVGYLVNDSAKTALESVERRQVALSRSFLAAFVVVRVAVLGSLVFWLATRSLQNVAILYALSSILVFAVLLLHTWIGCLRGCANKLRLLTFAILAYSKYLPATLLFLPLGSALWLLLPVFIAYGGGRVLDYGLIKFTERPLDKSMNLKWFICSLLPLLLLYFGGLYSLELIALILTFGSYYLVSFIRDHFASDWRRRSAG